MAYGTYYQDDLLTVAQAASMAGVSEATLIEWTRSGQLAAVQPVWEEMLFCPEDIVSAPLKEWRDDFDRTVASGWGNDWTVVEGNAANTHVEDSFGYADVINGSAVSIERPAPELPTDPDTIVALETVFGSDVGRPANTAQKYELYVHGGAGFEFAKRLALRVEVASNGHIWAGINDAATGTWVVPLQNTGLGVVDALTAYGVRSRMNLRRSDGAMTLHVHRMDGLTAPIKAGVWATPLPVTVGGFRFTTDVAAPQSIIGVDYITAYPVEVGP